jgi:hypothetical protein
MAEEKAIDSTATILFGQPGGSLAQEIFGKRA